MRAGVIFGVVMIALTGAFFTIGPETVVTSARQLFVGEAPPPAADLISVADRSYLTEEGRALLYASRPRIATVAEVAEACERSVDDPPAGCFNSLRGIFIYQPDDARVADAAVTTLAHELLHAAYAQLGDGEVWVIHDMLDAEIARVPADDPLHERIAWSVGGHEASRETELFAFLGSEVFPEGGFAPELEAVYARFFSDRAALVAVSRQVEAAIDTVVAETRAAFDALAVAEQANADARAQWEADRQGHEVARAQYNADADRYNAMSPGERGGWMVTWSAPGSPPRTAPLGESLAVRLSELEAYRVDLDARAGALAETEAAARTRRAEVEALYADLEALARSIDPGATFE